MRPPALPIHGPYLQNFLHWQGQSETIIKRELEDQGGQVRIMTVHGAKGLQAPIVILPDTIRTQRRPANQPAFDLHWPHYSHLPCPLYTGRQDYSFPERERLDTLKQQRDDAEYRRLLYVAMTRAEDRLYIGGANSLKPAIPESWYFMVRDGLESLANIERQENGCIIYTGPHTGNADKADTTDNKSIFSDIPTIPDFIFLPPATAEYQQSAVSPSRLAALREENLVPPTPSPLSGQPAQRFRRGIVTHRLLELLPAYTADRHNDLAQLYLTQYAQDLSEPVRAEIMGEVLAIIQDKTFAPLFSPQARAEVPITGHIGGQLISGKIDRLLITDNEILILDYKTNRPPPKNPENVPQAYRAQMQAYKALLQGLYNGRTVRCALLWTDGPVLMALDNL
ncbi:MAG: PD-(D/E)XK nuclease family protein [Alphaproteobacteria bacterium]|nr:PD-(D/E)XK nuclease family protein [Alphaproteobacteria bacterium]